MSDKVYGNGLTTNIDLERYSSYFDLPLVTVCCRDSLPSQVKDGFYIVNTDYERGSGKHWVCFGILNNNNACWYFDSLTQKMLPEIYRFLHHPSRPIIYNKKRIQDDTAEYCGYSCVLFGDMMYSLPNPNIESKMRYILELFDTNLRKNRKIIVELMNDVIKKQETENI